MGNLISRLLCHGRGHGHEDGLEEDGGGEFLTPQLLEVTIVGRPVRNKGLEAGQKAWGFVIAEFLATGNIRVPLFIG